ncbi:MAG: mannose-6-phosphate isomerase-like protein (cupin superfamily) [Planctomycetota bacterium]|jgi:mannose-6-phosphate isomerase-like protein (cupin superfamily)
MTHIPINLLQKFGKFNDFWSPRVVAEINDYQFKLAQTLGEFIWHKHDDTDEAFIVIEGRLKLEFRDGSVTLSPGEMFVVPKGVEHKPSSEGECKILVIEPKGVVNTGEEGSELTAPNDVWI